MAIRISMQCPECGANRSVHPMWLRDVFTSKDKPYKCMGCLAKESEHIKVIEVYI
jgi:DNA-directed RNA polymerase subunit RPC12/RpoP